MPKPTGKRCVNCGFAVAMCATVAGALPPQALAALHQWIPSSINYTQEQLQNEPICHECFTMLESFEAIETDNTSGEAGPLPRVLGHAKVCRLCGRSVSKIRSVSLELRPDNPKIQRILDEVIATSPKIFEHLKEVCRRCFQRVDRAVQKADAAGTTHSDHETEGTAANPEQAESQGQSTKQAESQGQSTKQAESQGQSTKQHIKKTIKSERLALTEYRRVFVSKNACAVKGCPRAAERAPLTTRRLLMRQRVYLPGYARLCDLHHAPDKTSFERNFNTGTFSGEQLADMLFLMKPAPPAIDADSIDSMDPHLRRMWLRVTLEQFETLCESHPRVPPRALAVRQCAIASGECAEVLASMFQLSRKDVNEALNLTEHLDLTLKDEPPTPKDRGAENPTTNAQYKQCMKNLVEKEAPATPEEMDVDVDTLLDQIMSE